MYVKVLIDQKYYKHKVVYTNKACISNCKYFYNNFKNM